MRTSTTLITSTAGPYFTRKRSTKLKVALKGGNSVMDHTL